MRRLAFSSGLFVVFLGLASACGSSRDGGDTQTNWLERCASDAECGGFACICGRCAKSCESDADCGAAPEPASCRAASSEATLALCAGSATTSGVCLTRCNVPGDCPSGQSCIDDACVAPAATAAEADVLNFCQHWVEALCDYTERCGCGSDAGAKCRTQYAAACEAGGFFGGLGSAVAAGTVIYDPVAADALLARFRAPEPSCVEEPFVDLRLSSDELYSWAGTFSGTLGLGSACSHPVSYKGGVSDCRSDLACAPKSGGGATCVALVGLGEDCDVSGDENLQGSSARICFDHRAPDSDGEYESAFDSLSCVPASAGSSRHICSRELGVGNSCDGGDACESGRCVSSGGGAKACAAPLADGATCVASSDCESGSCYGSVCGAPKADGDPCLVDADCQSGSCRRGDQSVGICGGGSAVGEPCSTDADCATETCRAGSCWADICGDYLEP
jgi:hypothetical protein